MPSGRSVPSTATRRSVSSTATLRWPSLLLAVLCVLSGCGATAPTDGAADASVEVSLRNAADEAYAVSLSVTRGPLEGVRITDANGTVRTFDVSDVSDVPPSALETAVDVEPVGPDVRTERYELPPNAGIGDTLVVPRGAALVYVVTRPGEGVRAWGKLTCGASASLSSVRVAVAPDGSLAVSNACRGHATRLSSTRT